MHILIVDNGTSFLGEIQGFLSPARVTTVSFDALDLVDVMPFDGIVLSGGHGAPVMWDDGVYAAQRAIIEESNKPIFGICLGFQLIAATFGATLQLLPERALGSIEVEVLEPKPIFDGMSKFSAYASHKWAVSSESPHLQVLARSKHGIEALQHRTKPIYGVQFHPEKSPNPADGAQVFANFLSIL